MSNTLLSLIWWSGDVCAIVCEIIVQTVVLIDSGFTSSTTRRQQSQDHLYVSFQDPTQHRAFTLRAVRIKIYTSTKPRTVL